MNAQPTIYEIIAQQTEIKARIDQQNDTLENTNLTIGEIGARIDSCVEIEELKEALRGRDSGIWDLETRLSAVEALISRQGNGDEGHRAKKQKMTRNLGLDFEHQCRDTIGVVCDVHGLQEAMSGLWGGQKVRGWLWNRSYSWIRMSHLHNTLYLMTKIGR